MTPEHRVKMQPLLLDGSCGKLFAIYFSPASPPHPNGDILLVPPFAEEMNRCRAMAAMQARALAESGIGTLILDPYGTGDSEGDFADADWELWRDDLTRGINWLREHGNGCRTLWGIRLGAIMATELATQTAGIDRLVFWQPVIQGRAFFTQFLRVQIAAELNEPGGVKTTDELRNKSSAGEMIEISGYQIKPALASTLDTLRMPESGHMPKIRLAWFEVLPSEEAVVPRNNLKFIEDCTALNMDIRPAQVIGPAFWQLHEREVAPELIRATTGEISAWTE